MSDGDNPKNKWTAIRQCKICFEEESEDEIGTDNDWISPCKCDGSIKWVHNECFKKWLRQAPFPQQNCCSTCRLVVYFIVDTN